MITPEKIAESLTQLKEDCAAQVQVSEAMGDNSAASAWKRRWWVLDYALEALECKHGTHPAAHAWKYARERQLCTNQ